jgi:hypothetical protein
VNKQEAKRMVAAAVKSLGVSETARRLGVGREAVLRFLSGTAVRRGTEALIVLNVDKLLS